MKKVFIITLLATTSLMAYLGQKTENIVHIEPVWSKSQRQIRLNLFLSDGYGIQKKPLHQVRLYQLDKKHHQKESLADKIKYHGRLLKIKKTLSGKTSFQSKEYFSALDPLVFSIKKDRSSEYAIAGKLFYCSFQDGFCSVYPFEMFIPAS